MDSQISDWPDPKSLDNALEPAPTFNAEKLLPPPLKEWILDEARRMPCPPETIAALVLVELGSTIGCRCALQPKQHDSSWNVVANLWGMVIAEVSSKKSPALERALIPLRDLEKKSHEQYSQQLATYRHGAKDKEKQIRLLEQELQKNKKEPSKIDIINAKILALQNEEVTEPILRRFRTNDATVPKLCELLAKNPYGLLNFRDELNGFFSRVNAQENSQNESDRAFYLETWSGTSSYTEDRVARGSTYVSQLCLSMFGSIQPDILARHLKSAETSHGNDGLLQRFQMTVFPEPIRWEFVDTSPNESALQQVIEIFSKLANFDPIAWGASAPKVGNRYPYFSFTHEAQDYFIRWLRKLHEEKLPKEEGLLAQHLAKSEKLFCSLALIFHLLDCAVKQVVRQVEKSSVELAGEWCIFLEAHARRMYGLLKSEEVAAQALVKKIQQGKLDTGFTVREIYRKRWRYLTEGNVERVVQILEDKNWVRKHHTTSKTIRYEINPKTYREIEQ